MQRKERGKSAAYAHRSFLLHTSFLSTSHFLSPAKEREEQQQQSKRVRGQEWGTLTKLLFEVTASVSLKDGLDLGEGHWLGHSGRELIKFYDIWNCHVQRQFPIDGQQTDLQERSVAFIACLCLFPMGHLTGSRGSCWTR